MLIKILEKSRQKHNFSLTRNYQFDGISVFSDPEIELLKDQKLAYSSKSIYCHVLIMQKNDSTEIDGHINMETGEDDISQLGIVRKWNYRETTKFFKSPCNVVEGGAGEFWPPNRIKDDITLFSAELCR